MLSKTDLVTGDAILEDASSQLLLLRDAIDSDDRVKIERAFELVARARGLTQLAADAGVDRATLHRAMQGRGEFSATILSDAVATLTRKLQHDS